MASPKAQQLIKKQQRALLLANAKRQLISPAHSLDLDANIQEP
jgi:hypothetical protein